MSTPANALDITQAGIVRFDGTSAFTAVTTTNHDVLIGAASNGITSIGPGTAGQVLQSGGAGVDPSYSTAVYPSTIVANQILFSTAANTIGGLANGTTGQVLTATTGGAPSWSTAAAGTVTSVSGTANRITSTGGATPVIDISAAYVGQTSITTLGTITTGVWNGTAIPVTNGGTGATTLTNHGVLLGQGTGTIVATAAGSAGQVLQSGGAGADPSFSTATYPATATGTGTILRADGTNWVATTSTYPATNAINTLLFASAPNVMSALTAGANGVLISSAGSVPSWLANGTTGQVLTATAGAPPSWTTIAGGGTVTSVSGTANRITSTGGAAPVIDIAATYVGQTSITTLGTVTTGVWNGTAVDVAHGGTGATTLTNHGILLGNGTGAVTATAEPSNGQILIGSTGNAPVLANLTAGTGISITNAAGSVTITNISSGGSTPTSIVDESEDFIIAATTTTISSPNISPPGWLTIGPSIFGGHNETTGYEANITTGHPGVYTVGTGTAATNNVTVCKFGNSGATEIGGVLIGGGVTTLTFVAKIPTLSTAGERFTIRLGLGTSPNASQTHGLWFEYSDNVNTGQWQIKSSSSSVVTTANTVSTADTNWHTFKIVVNAAGTSVAYFIDGVEVTGSPLTTNLPAVGISPFFMIVKSVGTTSRTFAVDLYSLNIVLTVPR